jgi:nitroreductase
VSEPSSDLYAAMRCAPSTRWFTDDEVDHLVLERVFDSARFAPSGGNRQGWSVIVVTDAALRTRLRELYGPPWEAYMVRTGGRALLDAADAASARGESGALPEGVTPG